MSIAEIAEKSTFETMQEALSFIDSRCNPYQSSIERIEIGRSFRTDCRVVVSFQERSWDFQKVFKGSLCTIQTNALAIDGVRFDYISVVENGVLFEVTQQSRFTSEFGKQIIAGMVGGGN